MEQSTSSRRFAGRATDIQGSLLLTNAGVLLIGVWASFGLAPVSNDAGATVATEAHPLALEAYDDACAAGDATACNNLGVSYQRGYGTERDDAVALTIFERTCRAGSAEACNNQAAMLEQRWGAGPDIAPIRGLYLQACTQGSALGCSNLGALYANGKGVPRDHAYARRLFERACQFGAAIGCENLVELEARALRHRSRTPSHARSGGAED
jgi:TPR repeat protein